MATRPTPNRMEITAYLDGFDIDAKRVLEDAWDETGFDYLPAPFTPLYGNADGRTRREWPKGIDLKLLTHLIGGGTRESYKPKAAPKPKQEPTK